MNELKVGKRIAELRNINNITQLELAEKLGVTDRAVSKWETGGGYPDIELLPQIADIFNVNIDYLFRGTPIVSQRFCTHYVSNNYNDLVNNEYLSNGWKIVDIKLWSADEAGICAVLMEKETFKD
jgi:transcriptional regulator with XRE-family HTH domain